MRLLNKRGDVEHHVYMTMIELVLVVMVAFGLLSFVDDKVSDRAFEKSYLSKDTALLINALYGSPQTVKFFYYSLKDTTDPLQYVFAVTDNKMVVKEVPGEGFRPRPIHYPFAEDKNLETLFEQGGGKAQIIFRKNNIMITMGDAEPVEKLKCPDISTTDADWKTKTIVIDQQDTRLSISQSFSDGTFDFISKSDRLDSAAKKQRISNSEAALLISQKVTNEPKITAYISFESQQRIESKKLACVILQKFNKQFSGNQLSIIPIVPSDHPDSDKFLLGTSRPSVLIEMNQAVKQDTAKVAIALGGALEEYYG